MNIQFLTLYWKTLFIKICTTRYPAGFGWGLLPWFDELFSGYFLYEIFLLSWLVYFPFPAILLAKKSKFIWKKIRQMEEATFECSTCKTISGFWLFFIRFEMWPKQIASLIWRIFLWTVFIWKFSVFLACLFSVFGSFTC